MLAILVGVLNGCKTPDGKLSGVVTYYFNDNYGDKPDVGASIYIMNNKDLGATKIDAIQKYMEAKMWYSIIEQDRQMMNSDSSFITSYIGLSKTAYSKESKARYDKQISDFQKRIADMEKDVETNWERLKRLKINSDEEYDNLAKLASSEIMDFRSAISCKSFTADGAGAYSTNLPPGNYSVLIISNHRRGSSSAELLGQISFNSSTIESEIPVIIIFISHRTDKLFKRCCINRS
jgi:hypothetical protein